MEGNKHMGLRSRWAAAGLGGAMIALALTSGISHSRAQDNLPADKMTVTASNISVSSPGQNVKLMQAQMRTSTPEDLVLQVTAECSILTTVTTTGNTASSSASGSVEIWLEIDGVRVPVATGDNGHVTFCNRDFQRTTSGFVFDNNATIKDYEATKSANGFNWAAFNLGNGIHTITVKANLTQTASDNNTAQAVVGNRTLTVQPTATGQNQIGA